MMVNGTEVKHWSGTQASRALSTAEAEHHAVVTGVAQGLGMQSMMTDLGLSARVRVWTDSNAAKAIASRRGHGNTRPFLIEVLMAAGGDQIRKSKDEGGYKESNNWRTT